MKKIFAIAIAAATFATSANALTIPSGSVITSGGEVVPAEQSENTQRRLAQDGVVVVAGKVIIDLNGETITVDVNDIRGKSKEQIGEVIGAAAVEQLQDLHDSAQVDVDEALANGQDAINAVGKTAQEIADHIMNSEASEGIVAGVSEAAHEAVQEILSNEIVIDANGEAYNPNNGPCSGAGC